MARRIHKERVRRDYDFEERRRREVRSNGEGDTTRSGPSSSRPTSPARQLTDTNQGEREIPPPPPAIRRVAWRPAGALPPPSPTKPRRTARFAANPQEPTTQRSTVATPTRDEMDTATAWRAATLLDALLHEVARFQPTWIPEFSSSTDGSGHQKGSHDAAVDQVLGDLAADAARLTRVVETLGEEAAIGPNTAFAVGGGGGRPDSPMSPTSRPGSPTSDSRSKPFSPPRTPDRSFRSTTRSSPSGAAPVDGRPPLLATAMIAWTSAARQARFDALAVPKAVAAKSPRSTPTSPSSSMSPTRPPWNASPAIRAKHAASSATASSATASRKPSAAVAKAGM
ncbi:hypothetical protein BC828DRAFT_375710 [Blastocladiella britannica]|nr:hypothetical protein BC828DRAFT_375710 [Blastocladiella britannica]